MPTEEVNTADLKTAADDLKKTLREVKRLSDDFARTLTGGLKSAIVEGKRFDDVMLSVARSMSARFLDRGLKPLQDALSSGFSSLAQGVVTKSGRSAA